VNNRTPQRVAYLEQSRIPIIERKRTNFGNVAAETAMNSRAFKAQQDTEIDRGPCRVGIATVGALGIAWNRVQNTQHLLVLLTRLNGLFESTLVSSRNKCERERERERESARTRGAKHTACFVRSEHCSLSETPMASFKADSHRSRSVSFSA